ncbi:MAG TPA: hypothetical protein VEA99_20980 [Gemmatimonadaceae bacterium]|nr:hypothetical protein [Gemmatimonadaceae bacterium]
MSHAPTRVRLGVEAGRALIGLWFLVVSLAGAQPLYRWLDEQHMRPAMALLAALGLAGLACAGIGLVAMAGFRTLMHAIAPSVVPEQVVVRDTRR